jgi:hypothetical protein
MGGATPFAFFTNGAGRVSAESIKGSGGGAEATGSACGITLWGEGSKRKISVPIPITSPSARRRGSWITTLFTSVPLLLCKSSIHQPPSDAKIRAWRRDAPD